MPSDNQARRARDEEQRLILRARNEMSGNNSPRSPVQSPVPSEYTHPTDGPGDILGTNSIPAPYIGHEIEGRDRFEIDVWVDASAGHTQTWCHMDLEEGETSE